MKKILLSALTASLLFTGSYAKETAAKDATAKEVSAIAVSNAKENAQNNQVKLVEEAISSLGLAKEALIALDKNGPEAATENLEKALGKLEVILASKDVPKLLPIDSLTTINEFIGTSDGIKKIVKKAKDLLDDGKVQDAREILAPLVSEIRVTTVSLPLATYPDALKLSAKYVHDKELEKAKKVISVALSTFVEDTVIIPIPLLKATDLIAAASNVAAEDTKRAVVYLEAAQEELKIAKNLGYVSKSDVTYKILDRAIDNIKTKIKTKEVQKLFDDLKAKMKDFSSKIFSDKEDKNEKNSK